MTQSTLDESFIDYFTKVINLMTQPTLNESFIDFFYKGHLLATPK